MMEPDDKTSTEEQNQFWGSVPEPGLETTPQAEQLPLAPVNHPESQLVSTPQAQIVGDLGQQPTSHFSATVSNSAQSGYNVSSPSITSDYDMSEKKKGMNWGQFAIGFFAPIVVVMLLTGISSFDNVYDERWDEVYKMEMITMFSDNGTFTHTFAEEITDNGRFEVNWCYSMGAYEGYQYECSHSYSDADKKIYEIKENEWNGEVVVGEYTQDNRTIWFSTDSHNISEMDFEFEFYDRELQEESAGANPDGGGFMDDAFCLLPLVGIVAIIISFARGNKSLGYGLITSASILFVLGAFFFILVMMIWF
jgi:hypothetical protein